MPGYAVSSSERYFGPIGLRLELERGSPAEALARVQTRLAAFVKAIGAGFFSPGSLKEETLAPSVRGPHSLAAKFDVIDLPKSALDLLAGILADCRHQGIVIPAAAAVLDREIRDLLVDGGSRPAALHAPFRVELPDDLGGNSALLVEIEFEHAIDPAVGPQLLDELALWETLSLAYPLDPDEGATGGGAQRHFNDPRTIHHAEWDWEADPAAWDLLVNLCCVWNQYHTVVRLHIE